MKREYKTLFSSAVALVLGMASASSMALVVNITQDLASVPVHHGNDFVKIQRIQDQSNVLTGGFTKTSRKCPPFCIQPLKVAPGVTTVAELELLKFIDQKLEVDRGVVIDARTPAWNKKGTIPGSINIPFSTWNPDQSEEVLAKALSKLNVSKKRPGSSTFWDKIKGVFSDDVSASSPWDFSHAQDVLLFCNGLWCGQSPRAIKGMIALGYPADKIYYYRGGMQAWQSLGLTVVVPK